VENVSLIAAKELSYGNNYYLLKEAAISHFTPPGPGWGWGWVGVGGGRGRGVLLLAYRG